MTLDTCGSLIEHNEVNAHGGALFFVSNGSTITNNTGGSGYEIAPQISGHSDTEFESRDSLIE